MFDSVANIGPSGTVAVLILMVVAAGQLASHQFDTNRYVVLAQSTNQMLPHDLVRYQPRDGLRYDVSCYV